MGRQGCYFPGASLSVCTWIVYTCMCVSELALSLYTRAFKFRRAHGHTEEGGRKSRPIKLALRVSEASTVYLKFAFATCCSYFRD